MDWAVIKIKGQQFKVTEGDEILVGKINKKKVNPDVLLVKKNKKLKIGKPLVKNSKVKLKVVEEKVKGKKIHVKKFKAKSRYRRKIGFRPTYTRLSVEKIT